MQTLQHRTVSGMHAPAVRRRDFLAGCAAAAGLTTAAGSTAAAATPVPPHRILLLDESRIAESVGTQLFPPPLQKLGPLLQGDSPGDSNGVSAAMGCHIHHGPSGRYRLYYTGLTKEEPRMGICVAESEDALHWTKPVLGQMRMGGADTNRIMIEGLPEGTTAGQPSIVHLPDGRWRMYFWLGRSKPRILRYVAAESAEGLHWKAVNVEKPCLRHPLEIGPWAWLDGPEGHRLWRESGGNDDLAYAALKRIRSNDAVHVYANPSVGYEMFAVWVLPNPAGSGRHVEYDNAKNLLRVIHRRTSEDGLEWSNPELLMVPDERDAWDQQFYYLAQHRQDGLRLGFLGNYRVVDQAIDIEFVYSSDGRHWRRPMRGAWLPRGPQGALDSVRVYMPTSLIDRGDHWLGLYSAADSPHNRGRLEGHNTVHGVRIPSGRFAGLSSLAGLTARCRSTPWIPAGPRLYVDAAIRGSLRAELCNAFGQPFPGFTIAESVVLRGDSPAHELRWGDRGTFDYQFDAVSLRLEWTNGMVYGISSAAPDRA